MFGRSAILGALTSLALLLGLAGPAAASDDLPLEFSSDGISWSSTPPAALFPAGIALVPGDSISATLWVRNATKTPGVFVAALRNEQADSAEAAFGFGLNSSTDDTAALPRTAFDELGTCAHLVPARVLTGGEKLAIIITVDLDSSLTGSQAQNDRISFDVWFGLSDAAAMAVPPNGICPLNSTIVPAVLSSGSALAGSVSANSSPHLSGTGGEIALAAILVAVALGGAGWLLMLLTRRARKKD